MELRGHFVQPSMPIGEVFAVSRDMRTFVARVGIRTEDDSVIEVDAHSFNTEPGDNVWIDIKGRARKWIKP